MFYLLKILIGRSAVSIDRPFSYACSHELNPKKFERVLVKFGNSSKVVGFIIEDPILMDCSLEDYNKESEFEVSTILSLLDDKPLLTDEQDKLARKMKEYYRCPLISIYQAMLPPSYKPKDSSLTKAKPKVVTMARALDIDISPFSYNEKKLYEKIKESIQLVVHADTRSKASYQSLLLKGAIMEFEKRIDRISESHPLDIGDVELSQEQNDAKDAIEGSSKDTILLEGVTGSGKTMVYLKLCEDAIREGKTAIILVPEIALTNHVISLFKTFFKDEVALVHSSLTPSARLDTYLRILEGKTSIVIGTRSALFSPLKNLAYIIIDEEHSSSYKQTTTPFYDSRVVARMRAANESCKVILSSATPLVEDRCRALNGLYDHVVIDHKYATSSIVHAKFIDMGDLSNISPKYPSMLSTPLIEAIGRTHEAGEQSMLLINRRGYSPMVQCKKCHRHVKCPNCDIPLTYHRNMDMVNCHRCEYRVRFEGMECQFCNNITFEIQGYGTERIQDSLQSIFPDLRIARLDRDTSKEKERGEILDKFSSGQYDLLIGTEMIAKGHDFPNVTLACALNADQSLSIPSFMSNENTFDLLCQLVGRSGRHEKEGTAIIQTYNPLNKVLILSSRQDYQGFYEMEIQNRKNFMWPPYCYLVEVTMSSDNYAHVKETAYAVKSYLVDNLRDRKCNIYGPYDPFERKVNNEYFKRILVKFKDPSLVKEAFDNLISIANPSYKDVKITIDMDPRGE